MMTNLDTTLDEILRNLERETLLFADSDRTSAKGIHSKAKAQLKTLLLQERINGIYDATGASKGWLINRVNDLENQIKELK